MLYKRIKFKRPVAIMLALVVAVAGGQAIIASFAAPTANIQVTAYQIGTNERIGNVTVTINSYGEGGNYGCNLNFGTTNADRSSPGFGQVSLTGCTLANRGNGVYNKYYNLASASKEGWLFHSASINNAGQSMGANNSFLVSAAYPGNTASIAVYMRENPDAPPPPSPSPTPPPDPTPAPNYKNGELEVTSFAFYSPTKQERQAGVKVALDSLNQDDGNPAVRCDSTEKTTDTNGGSSVVNPNYAQANFKDCWTSSDGRQIYKMNVTPPAGYTVRSIHLQDGRKFEYSLQPSANNPDEPFGILANNKTRMFIWLNPPPEQPAPNPAPEPAPPPSDCPGDTKGCIRVISRLDGSAEKFGNVDVKVETVGGNQNCSNGTSDTGDDNKGTTNASVDPSSVHITHCDVASDGGSKKYKLISASRSGYRVKKVFGADDSWAFDVEKNRTRTIQVIMEPIPVSAAGGGSGGGSSGGSSGGGSGGGSSGSPSADKNGSIQVVTYVYNSDDSKSPIGNVRVAVKSDTYPPNNTSNSCDQPQKTTDSANRNPASGPSNYGRAHFSNCWTSSGGKHPYQLHEVEIPSGYNFRSFRITSGNFLSGKNVADDLNAQFDVKANNETKLEVWLTKNTDLSPFRQNGQLAAVHEVVTAGGRQYVAARDNEASREIANQLNDAAGLTPGELSGGSSSSEENGKKPKSPLNLKTVQDPEAGAVTITWEPPDNKPGYQYVLTSSINGGEASQINDIDQESLEVVYDPSEEDPAVYDQPYTFSVYTLVEDDEGDEFKSEPVSSTVQVNKPAINVLDDDPEPEDPATTPAPAQPSDPQPGQEQQPAADNPPVPAEGEAEAEADDETTTVGGQEGEASVTIPNGTTEGGMACGVVGGSPEANNMAASIGTVVGNTQRPLCNDEEGNDVEGSEEDIEYEYEVDEEGEDAELFAFDGTDWEEVDTQEFEEGEDYESELDQNEKGTNVKYASAHKIKGKKTKYKIKSKKMLTLAVIKKDKGGVNPLVIIVPGLGLMTAVTVFVIRQRQLRLARARNSVSSFDPDLVGINSFQPDSQPEQISPSNSVYSDSIENSAANEAGSTAATSIEPDESPTTSKAVSPAPSDKKPKAPEVSNLNQDLYQPEVIKPTKSTTENTEVDDA